MKQGNIGIIIGLVSIGALVVGLNIADETTFLNTLIVERRSSAPTASTITRGRIYFDDVAKSYHGDPGTKIVELLTDNVAAHDILSTLHKDVTVATKVRGDLLVVDSVPKWTRFAKGIGASILQIESTGNDLKWLSPGDASSILRVNVTGADLAYLTPGTASQVLSIVKGGSDLEFRTIADIGWKLITSQDASASATIDFTLGIDNTYDLYIFVLTSILPATDAQNLEMVVSEDTGSTWKEGATDYEYAAVHVDSALSTVTGQNSQGAANILLNLNNIGSEADEGSDAIVYMWQPDGTAMAKRFMWDVLSFGSDATPVFEMVHGGGTYNGSFAAINGVRFQFASGNIASGTFALYGLTK